MPPSRHTLARVVGAVLAALRAAAPADAQPTGGPAERAVPRLLGCYALFDSTGTSALGRIPGAPAVVRLDTMTAAGPPGRFALPSDTGPRLHLVAIRADQVHGPADLPAARAAWRYNAWAVTPRADSLQLRFTTRFTGVVFGFGLPAAGGGRPSTRFAGRAEAFRDYGSPHRIYHGRATAARVPCPPLGAEPGRAGAVAPPPNEASRADAASHQ